MKLFNLLIVLIGFSCLDKMSYKTGHTYNIKESKERAVFVENYAISFSDTISDFYNLNFKEAGRGYLIGYAYSLYICFNY